MRMPRLSRPSRNTIAAVGVTLAFVLCVSGLAIGLFIEFKLRPIDGRIGLPQRLDFLCGRSYHLGNGNHMTKSEISSGITPGYEPYILEPTLGQIPLVDVLTKCPVVPMVGGRGSVTHTLVWLHVGSDDYVTYALEGGP